jgi:hypothetical protein
MGIGLPMKIATDVFDYSDRTLVAATTWAREEQSQHPALDQIFDRQWFPNIVLGDCAHIRSNYELVRFG